MKSKKLYILLTGLLFAVLPLRAADGIIATNHIDGCAGDTITVRLHSGDRKLFTNTTLRDTIPGLPSTSDSINIYVVTFHPAFESREERQLVEGTTFQWHNQTISKSGVYRDSKPSIYGCDSVYILNVTAIKAVTSALDTTVTICQGTSITWNGITATAPGVYSRQETTPQGGQITYTLTVNIKQTPVTRFNKTICKGEDEYFNGRLITESGVYRDTLKATLACDSIIEWTYTVLEPDLVIETHEMEEGETYKWNGKDYKEAGIYSYHTKNKAGCDSIVRLVLTTHHVDRIVKYDTICSGQSVTWQGITGRDTHTYSRIDTLTSGDIVIYTLHLVVKQPVMVIKELAICTGNSEFFNGKYYDTPGTFYDSISCDTIYKVLVGRQPVREYVTKGVFDGNTPYIWRYADESVPVLYEGVRDANVYNPVTGCTDHYHLELHKQVTAKPRTQMFCEQITFKGQTYTYSTTVYDTLYMANYVDSIIITRLVKGEPFRMVESITLREGQTIYWHGQTISNENTYYDINTSVAGCDSTYELHVKLIHVDPPRPIFTDVVEICSGDTYTWPRDGKEYSRTDIYKFIVPAVLPDTMDTTYMLNLTVHPAYDTAYVHLYNCGGTSMIYEGKEYVKDTTITTTYQSIHGCDSVTKAFLHFNTASFNTDTLHIGDTDTARTWFGQKINHGGTYFHQEKLAGGCYRLYQLVVFMHPTFFFEKDTAICQNEAPYVWRLPAPEEWVGKEFSCSPGETLLKEWHGTTVHGLDSIYRLRLTVNPSYTKRERITMCAGESENINGKTYENLIPNKIYRDTVILRTENACDSIIYYEISQLATKRTTITRILHLGDTIFWYGDTITSAKQFPKPHIVPQVGSGCDSIIELVVIQETSDTIEICSLDPVSYPYIWGKEQKEYYTSGTWVDTVFEDGRIKEFHTLYLTVTFPVEKTVELRGCQTEGVTFNGKTYFESQLGVLDTLRCDTIYHLNIKIDPVYNIRFRDTICETELPYILGRQDPVLIWEEGEHPSNPEKTACGCDSMATVTLTIIPDLNHDDSVFLCNEDISQSEPYILGNLTNPKFAEREGGKYKDIWKDNWKGIEYTKDTIVWNCTHDHFFHIIVRPPSIKDSVYYLCELDTLHFGYLSNGERQLITKEGVYFDTIKATSGWMDTESHGGYHYSDTLTCDSIIKLTVYLRPAYRDTIERHIPLGDSILWGGTYKYFSGLYSDSIEDLADMDSRGEFCHAVHSLRLFVDSTYLIQDTIDVCAIRGKTLTHVWKDGHSQKFTTPQEEKWIHYYDSLNTKVYHFDSVYDLYVNFHITPITYLDSTICDGDSIQFGLTTYSQPRMIGKTGIYYDTLKAVSGCDSIIKLTLNVYPNFSKSYIVDIADRDTPYVWVHKARGIEYGKDSLYAAGKYSYRFESVHGCDSVDNLTLTIHNTYNFHDTVTLCQSELPYTWRDSLGHVMRENIELAGTYVKPLLTKDGYDSIYNLTVFVLPTYVKDIYVEHCAGDSLQLNHKKYTKPGIYRDTLLTVGGCDSVIILHYSWSDTYYIRKTAKTDDKRPYLWKQGDGSTRVLTASGVYFDSIQTKDKGCDSIIELTLTVYPTYRFEEKQTICESEAPYIWRGKQCWKSGLYTDSLQTKMHYDSIFVLNLTIKDTAFVDLHYTICRGESFVYNGKTYTHGGVWSDTLSAINGCDSIVVIRVQELPDYFFSDTAAVANRQPYPWRGKIYTHTGIYQDTLQTVSSGCDSIYQLVLTVYDKEQFRDTTIMVCESSLPYQWKKKWLSKTTTFYDTITTGDVDTIWQVNFKVVPMEYETIERTLCDGETYKFNGKTFTRDTLFRELVYAGYGCGKEYTIYLHFRKPRTILLEAKTSIDKPYKWNVEDTTYTYRFSGNYEHIVRTKDGLCDSLIYQLHLTVGQVYLYKDSMPLCQSELPYIWHNQFIYEAGMYYDSLQTVMGYDSVYMLKVLKIMPSYYEERTINLCEGASAFYYRGKPYSKPGIFFDTIPSISGCDSIFRITVRVMPTFEIYDTVHISDKQTYLFDDGRNLSVPGPYIYYGKTKSECDSIVHLQLYVHPSYLFQQEGEICQKDSFLWRGRAYYAEGIYYDSLLSTQGYDSVYKLTLTVHKTYYKEEAIEICPNTTTWLHGMDISSPGIYYDTLYTIHGCDSVFKITVNLKRSFRQEFTAEICQGDEYMFFGVPYTRSGTYKYEIGCDSIITMHLIVHPRDIIEKRVVISEEDLPYRYGGNEYWKTDVYVDTAKNVYGCDSIFKLNLIVSEHASEWYQMPLCPNGEIRIDGQIITEAGLYTFLKRSKVSGLLDSLYRVEVYDAPDYESKWDTIVACQGDTVFFAGKQLIRAGAYTETLKTIKGCDSILHLLLIVNPTYEFTTNATIIDYQNYIWRGSEYTKQGKYYQSYPTIKDCDSTYILDLKVIPTLRYIDSTAICINSSVTWRGRELSDPGIYNDTVANLASFTSVIYTLKLTVVTPTIITKASVTDIEADAESFNINFSYSGLRPERYSITFDDLAHQQGFTDIIDKPFGPEVVAVVPMPHKEKIIYQEHTAYVRPNNYTMRLALDNGVCGISRSDSLTLLVRYPSWIIEQNWDNVVVPLRKEYNGGYEFGNYTWYVNDMMFSNNGSPYLYTNTLRRGDRVVLYATRVGESYAIPTAPLVITVPAEDVFDKPVLVAPTSTSKTQARVKIQANEDGTYKVYNTAGQLFSSGDFTSGEQTIEVPATTGCCFVQTTTASGVMTTTKIIVY